MHSAIGHLVWIIVYG